MRYLYGPVKSRRLGNSLGITTVGYKTCCFDCIYCQLGKTKIKTTEQKEYIAISDVVKEVKEFLRQGESNKIAIDYITLAGFGEPTLNIKIGELIDSIKKITAIPVAVLTNSALLINKEVRKELLRADLICPSLDALSQDAFERINRPLAGIKIDDIINSLHELRSEFKGKIFLEIMLIRNINDNFDNAKKILGIVESIKPDKIYINIPTRYTAEKDIEPPEKDTLERIKSILDEKCEILN